MDMKTPGVYIVEKNAFPNSIVPVPTAVPAFIGHTEKAEDGHKSLTNVPFRISSMLEYHQSFGGKAEITTVNYALEDVDSIPEVATQKKKWENEIDPSNKTALKIQLDALRKKYSNYSDNDIYLKIASAGNSIYTLYYHILLFFANGGQSCYIVSVGDYKIPIGEDKLEKAVAILEQEQEPTMVVIPEAVNLSQTDFDKINRKMLDHCGDVMKNRIAILDVYNGFKPINDPNDNVIGNFQENTSEPHLKFASAYYPWLRTSFIDINKINVDSKFDKVYDGLLHIFYNEGLASGDTTDDNNNHRDLSKAELEYQCKLIDADASIATDKKEEKKNEKRFEIGKKDKLTTAEAKSKHTGDNDPTKEEYIAAAKEILTSLKDEEKKPLVEKMQLVSDKWTKIMAFMLGKASDYLNFLPPSATIAGIYAKTDNARGVWKAPGNIAINSILGPTVNISDKDQEDLNMPSNGKAINAIRYFPNEGTKVWGARTLDGNSQDWRYINVRRTMIFLEESIKNAVRGYVFEPNDANTWVNVKSSIDNFLHSVWKQGGLVGAKAEDAYCVNIGLGSTMTSGDILDGIMRVAVLVAVSHPAEFIEITFQQQMQKS